MKDAWHKRFAGYYIPGGWRSFALIAAATAFVTWLHIGEQLAHSILHLFHYYLFYLLVIYTAHSFGFLGGVISAFLLSLIYNGRMYFYGEIPQDVVRPILEVAMMYTLGIFSGLFSQKLYLEKEKLFNVSEELKKSIELIEKNADEKIRLEKEIARADRLRVLGQLTAGIAHEIRNPLAAIKSGVLMIRDGKGNEKVMNIVTSEIDRLNSFVERFLQYAKIGKDTETDIAAVELFGELAELARLVCKDRQNTKLGTENRLANNISIRGDRNYLKQALLNIIINGIEAVDEHEKGVVTFSADYADGNVIFVIKDNGKGIDATIQEKIFEPFFTTKNIGTGLGLTIASKVIKEHSGEISVVNDNGARVIIKIPGRKNKE
jgi:two-component system sensor histidine kinase HydH